MKNKALTLRPFADSDLALMTGWLRQEHVAKWYHEPEDWLVEINGRQDAFAWIHHFIVMQGDVPMGFCQYYDCYDANDLEEWYHVERRGDTFSIDYLIGDAAYLGKGYGKAIVELLTDTVRQKEKARQIIVQPERDNQPSNHVLLANGYVYDEQKAYFYTNLLSNSR